MKYKAKPVITIDQYLERQSAEARDVLQQLREFIKKQVPQAEETISYAMPIFKYHGMLVGFAAYAKHFGFYPCNGSSVEKFKDELKGFETSKGAIRFTKEKPIPEKLLKKIIKERVAENKSKEILKKK